MLVPAAIVQNDDASMWNGTMGLPVARASHTRPGCATRGGSTRTIDRECDRMARRASHGGVGRALSLRRARSIHAPSITKPADDPGNPLPVEVLARDDDNAAIAKVEGRGKNSAVPARENRLSALAITRSRSPPPAPRQWYVPPRASMSGIPTAEIEAAASKCFRRVSRAHDVT